MTRSASMTPSSMSLASSEASLTLCSGTLRTSIGAGTGSPCSGRLACSGAGGGSGGEDGAGAVAADGVGDVLQGRDDGSRAARFHEAEDGVDLRAHAAAGELTGCRVGAQFV